MLWFPRLASVYRWSPLASPCVVCPPLRGRFSKWSFVPPREWLALRVHRLASCAWLVPLGVLFGLSGCRGPSLGAAGSPRELFRLPCVVGPPWWVVRPLRVSWAFPVRRWPSPCVVWPPCGRSCLPFAVSACMSSSMSPLRVGVSPRHWWLPWLWTAPRHC